MQDATGKIRLIYIQSDSNTIRAYEPDVNWKNASQEPVMEEFGLIDELQKASYKAVEIPKQKFSVTYIHAKKKHIGKECQFSNVATFAEGMTKIGRLETILSKHHKDSFLMSLAPAKQGVEQFRYCRVVKKSKALKTKEKKERKALKQVAKKVKIRDPKKNPVGPKS